MYSSTESMPLAQSKSRALAHFHLRQLTTHHNFASFLYAFFISLSLAVLETPSTRYRSSHSTWQQRWINSSQQTISFFIATVAEDTVTPLQFIRSLMGIVMLPNNASTSYYKYKIILLHVLHCINQRALIRIFTAVNLYIVVYNGEFFSWYSLSKRSSRGISINGTFPEIISHSLTRIHSSVYNYRTLKGKNWQRNCTNVS